MNSLVYEEITFVVKYKNKKNIHFKVIEKNKIEISAPLLINEKILKAVVVANIVKIKKGMEQFKKLQGKLDAFAPDKSTTLDEWKRNAQEEILSCAFLWEEIMKVNPAYIKVKDMKTRWGSCTGKNGVNLNIRLAYVPKEVLAYVIIHEFSHIAFKDHKKSFWERVHSYDENYKEHQKWLRDQGEVIMNIPLSWVKKE